jgi:hypothetical protein
LTRALADPATRHWAVSTLGGMGSAAAPAADALWALVDEEKGALRTLCRLHDQRAGARLAQRLSAEPVDWADSGPEAGLEQLLSLIGPWAASCREPLLRLVPSAPEGNLRIGVIGALGRLTRPDDPDVADVVAAIRAQAAAHPHITMMVLGDLGPAAVDALPEVREALNHEEPIVRVHAARALFRIAGAAESANSAEAALPALRAALGTYAETTALAALADFGPAGAELAGVLPELMGADDDWTAVRAAIAHWRITGDAGPVVPVLMEHAEPGDCGIEAVRRLGEIGPDAAAAVPLLQDAVDSEYVEIRSGSAGMLAAKDEEWADACREALAKIQP